MNTMCSITHLMNGSTITDYNWALHIDLNIQAKIVKQWTLHTDHKGFIECPAQVVALWRSH